MNRGLTKEQAERGVQPEPLTKAEWKAMRNASVIASVTAQEFTHTVDRAIKWWPSDGTDGR